MADVSSGGGGSKPVKRRRFRLPIGDDTERRGRTPYRFLTEDLLIVLRHIDPPDRAAAMSWNVNDRSPVEIAEIGAAVVAMWREDRSMPTDLVDLRCAVIYADEQDLHDADLFIEVAFARIEEICEAERDGPTEPTLTRNLTGNEVWPILADSVVKPIFSDQRYAACEVDGPGRCWICVECKADPDNWDDEYSHEELATEQLYRVFEFDDPFVRARFRRSTLGWPIIDSFFLRKWERARDQALIVDVP